MYLTSSSSFSIFDPVLQSKPFPRPKKFEHEEGRLFTPREDQAISPLLTDLGGSRAFLRMEFDTITMDRSAVSSKLGLNQHTFRISGRLKLIRLRTTVHPPPGFSRISVIVASKLGIE